MDGLGRRIMYIVLVNVHVKESAVGDFKLATLENAAASLLEPGIARFDVLQLIWPFVVPY